MCAVVGVYPCSRTDTNGEKMFRKLPQRAFIYWVCLSGVCLSVCLFALLLACDAYTEPIQTRSGLTDARYLCLKLRAEIAELGHVELTLTSGNCHWDFLLNFRVLSQAASNTTTPINALLAPPSPPPPHHRYHHRTTSYIEASQA